MQTSLSQRCGLGSFNSYRRIGETDRRLRTQSKPQNADGLRPGVLLAATWVLIWAALWWLLIDAYVRPLEPPRKCDPGTIELSGACVLGEEIEVRVPLTLGRRGR